MYKVLLLKIIVGLVLLGGLYGLWTTPYTSVYTHKQAPPEPLVVHSTSATSTSSPLVATTSIQAAPPPVPSLAKTKPQQKIPLPIDTPVTQTTPPVKPSKTAEEVNRTIRESLVNILCTTKNGGSFQPISGSGIVISNTGVVLTNAHIGQFFLLRDYIVKNNIDCIIRTGSPATAVYRAVLLYLPPAWVEVNAKELKNTVDAVGTGENDYAFLLITSGPSGSDLPPSLKFPNTIVTTDTPAVNDQVVLASYPAQFLGGVSIQKDLYASTAVAAIQKLFTFAEDNGPVDVVSLGSSIVAQSGSSGGGVARLQDGALEALITTATGGSTTNNRQLNAITLAHIDRSLAKYGKGGLVPFLTEGDLAKKAEDFNKNTAPGLIQLLVDALK